MYIYIYNVYIYIYIYTYTLSISISLSLYIYIYIYICDLCPGRPLRRLFVGVEFVRDRETLEPAGTECSEAGDVNRFLYVGFYTSIK